MSWGSYWNDMTWLELRKDQVENCTCVVPQEDDEIKEDFVKDVEDIHDYQ